MSTPAQLRRHYCRSCNTTTLHVSEACMYCHTVLPMGQSSGVLEGEFRARQRTGKRGARSTNRMAAT